MQSYIKFLLLFFLPLFGFGQKNCNGFVVDKLTGTEIPYATIGLMRENKGVNANENGSFSIDSYFKKDSLRVSSVGYETRVLPVSEWSNGKIVALQPITNFLAEVVISSKPEQIYSFNLFRNCSSNDYLIGQKVMYQLAQKFDTPEPGLHLKYVEICKDASMSIFRIRIYDMDSVCKCPSTDIADTLIEVKSSEKHVRIDLQNYNIFISGKVFFVAIEWIWVPFNEAVEKHKVNGKKLNWTWNKPALRWVKNRNKDQNSIWVLNYNGNWIAQPGDQDKKFQISATLSNRKSRSETKEHNLQ